MEVDVPRCRNLANSEIDRVTEETTTRVMCAIEKCIRQRVIKVDETDPLPEEIVILIKKRRNALKEKWRAKLTGNVGWVNLMDSTIKEITTDINKRIADHENERLEARLAAIPNNHNAFAMVDRLAGKKAKKAEDCDFTVKGKKVTSLEGKAEVMCAFYEKLYKESTPKNSRMTQIEATNVEVEQWSTGITFSADRQSYKCVTVNYNASRNASITKSRVVRMAYQITSSKSVQKTSGILPM